MILSERMAALADQRLGLPAPAAERLSEADRLRNSPYALSRVPLLVDRAAIEAVRPLVEAYVQALDQLLEDFRGSSATRSWFGFTALAEDLILSEAESTARVRVCRLDGYVCATPEGPRLRLLENNADAPAGTLFTSRLNHFHAELWGDTSQGTLAMERSPSAFLDFLIEAAGRPDPVIVVLQRTSATNRESVEIVRALQDGGHRTYLADPRELGLHERGFELRGEAIDVIWNKINTVDWLGLVRENRGLVERWCEAMRRGGTIHLNGFAARYVAEAKTALAWLLSPELSGHLEPQARTAVDELLPRTRRLGRELIAEALERQHELVLKRRYDIRGDGVTLGSDVTQGHWRRQLEDSVDSGAVLQDYVEPLRVPVLLEGWTAPESLRHSLDWFLFDGRLVGLGSKASRNTRVNVFRGGTKLAVSQIGP